MPKPRRYSITASGDDDEAVPIVASYVKNRKTGRAPKTHLALLSCNDCNHQVLGSNSVMPFCSACTGTMTASSEDTLAVPGKEIDEDYKEIATCSECDSVISTPTEFQASFDDNSLYCPCCSNHIQIKADDEDEEDSNSEDEDNEMSETVDEDADSNLFDNDKNEGSEETSEEKNEDKSAETSEEKSDTEENPAENTEGNTSENSEKTETEGDSVSEDKSNTNTGGGTLNANLVQALSGKSGEISVVASPDKSKWFLFLDNYPVAASSKDNASDNVKSMFDNDKFATAWSAAITDGVTEDILNDFGFVATTVDVPVDEAVKQTVEASLREHEEKYRFTASEVRNRFDRCFGIAAVGINKDVFKENNPVKMALIASLQRNRVRNAEQIVANAFEEHGEEYLNNVSNKASELMDKSDESLDDLAKTVDEARVTKTVETETVTAPKITTFPKPAVDKIEEEAVVEEKELAASDNNTMSKIDLMANRFRRMG